MRKINYDLTQNYIQIHLLLIVIAMMLLVGCHSAWVSQASMAPKSGWIDKKYGGGKFLIGSDVDILVKASNSTDEREVNRFGISLWFDPKQPNLSFSPDKVALFFSDLGEVKPERMELKWTGANRGGWECGRTQKSDFGAGPPYTLYRGFCVELYFDIKPPSPEKSFTMRIMGLARENQSVSIPDIYFEKDSVTVIDLPFFP
jgi:hypothetical protein